MNYENLSISELKPAERNARRHQEKDIEAIKKSIQEFGFNDPIGVWGPENTIVEGHGRLQAASELGLEKVPVVHLDHLTDEQRRAYALVHNRTAELSEWDLEIMDEELAGIFDIDMNDFGFLDVDDWFSREDRNDTRRQEGNDEYNDFLDKFEQKKTTDDCYTPDNIYDAVAKWVETEYDVKRENFVRPFFPGGNYRARKYQKGDIVVDNPPFSILAEIIRFYCEEGIRFFLFAPHLTLCNPQDVSFLATNAGITYENGATVNTSFVTNMDTCRIRSTPELHEILEEVNKENLKELRVQHPKYDYPSEVITSAAVGKFSKYGIDFRVEKEDAEFIRALDAQKEAGTGLFGSGFLLSERAAAERAAAERAAAVCWKLSDREREIVKRLGATNDQEELEG